MSHFKKVLGLKFPLRSRKTFGRANVAEIIHVVKGANSAHEGRKNVKTYVGRSFVHSGYEIDDARLENIHRRVSAAARRIWNFFMKSGDNALRVFFDDAATLRGVGVECHHGDVDAGRALAMAV